MEFHEAANIFPLLEGDEFNELVDDIRKHGLREPIKLLDGKIIDGRNRYRACLVAQVVPRKDIAILQADETPVDYVVSMNINRRHLTPSQRAMCAARAREFYDKEAKERQKRKPADSVVENFPQQKTARDAAGKSFGVSGKSVDHATKVLANAEPEIIKAVDEGRMAVSSAVIHSTEPPEVQKQIAADPRLNRTYKSVSKPHQAKELVATDEHEEPEPGKSRGIGIQRAHDAIACLKRIPKNDALRKRGFQVVTDWIRQNK